MLASAVIRMVGVLSFTSTRTFVLIEATLMAKKRRGRTKTKKISAFVHSNAEPHHASDADSIRNISFAVAGMGTVAIAVFAYLNLITFIIWSSFTTASLFVLAIYLSWPRRWAKVICLAVCLSVLSLCIVWQRHQWLSARRSVEQKEDSEVNASNRAHDKAPDEDSRVANAAGEVLLIIGEFSGPDPEEYGVSSIIRDRIDEALKGYSDVRVQLVKESIINHDEVNAVRAKYGASIVLWGNYIVNESRVRVTAHFEVVEPRAMERFVFKEMVTRSREEFDAFTIQDTLSRKLSFLTLIAVALIRLTADDCDGAIARLNEALRQNEEFMQPAEYAEVIRYRGMAYAKKGESARAIADLGSAIKASPTDCASYNTRGLIYWITNRDDLAFSDFEMTIKCDPRFSAGYQNRGDIYRTKGQYDQALADYNKAIELASTDIDVCLEGRGILYTTIGRYGLAVADFTEAIKINSRSSSAYYNRAYIYEKTGDYDKAIMDCNAAIKYYDSKEAVNIGDNMLPQFYNTRALAYSDKGEYNLALSDFNEALRIKPDFVWAYSNRGDLYNKLRNYDSALIDLSRAIGIQPNFAPAYNNRGNTFKAKGLYDRALADYTAAVQLDHSYAVAYDNRGLLYTSKAEYERAITDFNEAIKLDPKLDYAFKERGDVYFRKGEYARAISDYSKALELRPSFLQAQRQRDRAYERLRGK